MFTALCYANLHSGWTSRSLLLRCALCSRKRKQPLQWEQFKPGVFLKHMEKEPGIKPPRNE